VPEYTIDEEGRVVPLPSPPAPIPPPTPIEPEERVEVEPVYAPEPTPEPEVEDELADLFTVPQPDDNDMKTDHLLEVPEETTEEDLADLFEVGDIMDDEEYPGTPPTPEEIPRRTIPRRYKRTPRRYQPPPMGGMSGLRI